MNVRISDYLANRGEFFAFGWAEMPSSPIVCRFGRALRRQLENCALPTWDGGPLYPTGPYSIWMQGAALSFSYSYPFCYQAAVWQTLIDTCQDEEVRQGLAELGQAFSAYPSVFAGMPREDCVGGNGYTHSILNYGRIVIDGFGRYVERISAGLATAAQTGDEGESHLFSALEDVMAGVRAYHARLLARLQDNDPCPARERLLAALQRVPWGPAADFYEGLVAVNFAFFLDGCDSLGRLDQVLGALYEEDLTAGRLTEIEGEDLVRCLWRNMDANTGWNVALGGTTAAGAPAYNRLTLAGLRAARGQRRPNLALKVRRDMPHEIWDAALDCLAGGGGLPALYNEEAYLSALKSARLVSDSADLVDFAFGGCTETMIHGLSNVGSLDGGLNLVHILAGTLRRTLAVAPDFESLLCTYEADTRARVARLAGAISRQQQVKADFHPQLIRTLFIDDCLERGVEYNAGGARYNWSVVNVCGLSNVVDSLAAVREVVYERGEISGAELLSALEADFRGFEVLRRRLARCPRFGNDHPAADELARRLSTFVFGEFARHKPWRGRAFLPGCLMFVCYADAGKGIMATPDGRSAGAPIADSAGPVAGRDRQGPTAMMRSIAALDMQAAPGTLVVNLRLNPDLFRTADQRANVQALIQTYFGSGNMQLQINVVDQAVLQAALDDPDAYANLLVRVGGYSEYWCRLTPELRRSILERTVYGL
jgi:pyruvate-formate lyase